MKCPKCRKGRLRQVVQVLVECDAENRKLDKKGIRSKNVAVMGVDWDRARFCCPNCGVVVDVSERGKNP